jgi:hypothetical protein
MEETLGRGVEPIGMATVKEEMRAHAATVFAPELFLAAIQTARV